MAGLAGMVLLLSLLVPLSETFAAENRHLDNIHRVLEASTFTGTEQAAVNTRAAAAINIGVPGEDVEIIVLRAVGRGTDPGAINRFLDAGISAKKEGLPVRPVLDRIEQGLSKGVPSDRIAAASERLAEKLATAQPIVDSLIRDGVNPGRSNNREDAIESTARALEKSMNPQDVEAMGAAVRGQRGSLPLFTSAVDTATYFTGNGMTSKKASQLVRHAIEKGYSERDLDGMVKIMDDEMKQGASAADIEKKMERGNMQGERGMEHQDMRQEMKTDRGTGSGSGMGGHGM